MEIRASVENAFLFLSAYTHFWVAYLLAFQSYVAQQ